MSDFKCFQCGISWDNGDESCTVCRHFSWYMKGHGECKITGASKGLDDLCDLDTEENEFKRFHTCPECGQVIDDIMSIQDAIKINEGE